MLDVPPLHRMDFPTQKRSPLAIYNMHGTLTGFDQREVKGSMSLVDMETNKPLPLVSRIYWQDGHCRFKISFTLPIGSLYTIQAVFSGEPEGHEALGPALCDPLVLDLTL
jgi:hypothetical protein